MGPLPSERNARSAGTREVAIRNSAGVPRLVSIGSGAAPTPKCFAGKDVDVKEATKCLEREVTPQALAYFQRIVKVAQSELEKLLVHKMQILFEPAPGVMSVRAAAGGKTPCNTLGKEAYCEGQDLMQYFTGVLSRILLDFSRFSDTILKWENIGRADEHVADKGAKVADKVGECSNDSREVPDWVEALINGTTGSRKKTEEESDTEAIVARLERQDQQNTALEEKCNRTMVELNENRRAFLRERMLFEERLRILKSYLSDAQLREYADHDVQFYEDEPTPGEDLETIYLEKMAKLREEMQSQLDMRLAEIRELHSEIVSLNQEKAFLKEQMDRLKSLLKKQDENEKQFQEEASQTVPLRVADAEIQCELKPDFVEQGVQSSSIKLPRDTKPTRHVIQETKLSILASEAMGPDDGKSKEVEKVVVVQDRSEEVDALKRQLQESEAAVKHLVSRVSALQGRLTAHCELVGRVSGSNAQPAQPSRPSVAPKKTKHEGVQTDPMTMPESPTFPERSSTLVTDNAPLHPALQGEAEEPEPLSRPKHSERPPCAGGFLQGGEVSPRTIEGKAGLYVIARRESLGWVARHCGLRELLREGYHPSEPLTKDEYEAALAVLGTSPDHAKSLFSLAGNGSSTATLAALFCHIHSILFGDSAQFCELLHGDFQQDAELPTSSPNAVAHPRMALAVVPPKRPRSALGQADTNKMTIPGPVLRPKSAPGVVSPPHLYKPPIPALPNFVTRQNYGGGFTVTAGPSKPFSSSGTQPSEVKEQTLPAGAHEPAAEPAPAEMDLTLTQPIVEPAPAEMDLTLTQPVAEPSEMNLTLTQPPVDEQAVAEKDKPEVAELPEEPDSGSTPGPWGQVPASSPIVLSSYIGDEPRGKAPLSCWSMSGPTGVPTVQHRFPQGKALVPESMQGSWKGSSRPRSAAEATVPKQDREPSQASTSVPKKGHGSAAPGTGTWPGSSASAPATRPGSAATTGSREASAPATRPGSAVSATGARPCSSVSAGTRPSSAVSAATDTIRGSQSSGALETTSKSKPPSQRTLLEASDDFNSAPTSQPSGSASSNQLLRTMSVPDFPIERPGELGGGFGAAMRGSGARPPRTTAQNQVLGRVRPRTPSGPPGAALRSRVAPAAVSWDSRAEEGSRRPGQAQEEPPARPSRYLPQDLS